MQHHLAVHIDWIGSRAFLIRFLLFHIMYTYVWDIHCSVDDANFVECRNEWKKEKEHFFFFDSKDSKICGIYVLWNNKYSFSFSFTHSIYICGCTFIDFFQKQRIKKKNIILCFYFCTYFFKFLKRIKISMVFIIVLNNSGWKISRVLSIFSPLLFYHCQCRGKSIGLRWEIKKASIVSSNLGILAPVLEGNCSSIKFDIFFALLELKRYRFDYFVFVAKII